MTLPFVQVGFSYYASVALLLLLVGVMHYRRFIVAGVKRVPLVIFASVLMLIPGVRAVGADASDDLLRCAREGVLLVLLASGIAGLEFHALKLSYGVRMRWTSWWCAGMLALVAVQILFYARGIYFGLPASWYVMNSSTIATELSLKYSEGNLRPSGTYGEASYLGFVLLSLGLMVAPLAQQRRVQAALALIVGIGLLSRSLSFFLSAILVLLIPMLLNRRNGRRGAIGAALVALPLLMFTQAGAVLDRLAVAGWSTTADVSTTSRVWAPLSALPSYLIDHPLGLGFKEVLIVGPTYYPSSVMLTEIGFDNGLLNLFFKYGLLGAVVVVALMSASRDPRIRFYLLCSMMFNGDFFSIDKVGIILISVAGYIGAKRVATYAHQRTLVMQRKDAMSGTLLRTAWHIKKGD